MLYSTDQLAEVMSTTNICILYMYISIMQYIYTLQSTESSSDVGIST